MNDPAVSVRPQPRVAYVFTTSRDALIAAVTTKTDADTALRGLNHLPHAEHFVVPPTFFRSLTLVPRLLTYDFIIAQDHLPLGYIVSRWARLFGYSTQWIHLSMTVSTLKRRFAHRPVRLFLLQKFWSSYARIVCLSSEQIADFVALGIPRERLVFIPLGVDAAFFAHTGHAEEENLFVSVGRDAGRDYPTLFKAMEHLPYRCIIVASPSNISSNLPTPENVSIRYDLGLADVRALYARARFVVVVSKKDGAPVGSDCSGQTVVLDALAAGKAVIATRRSWIADYLTPGEDLIVIEPSDPRALANAITDLFQNKDKCERLAASGRAKVVGRYTTAAFAKSLQEVMRSCL